MRGPNTAKTNRARALRKTDNGAEAALWAEIRNRRLNGSKFIRQFPIGPYFSDFACREKRLVVEIDGSQHAGSQVDARRDAFMNAAGWSVGRFWSTDVFKDRAAQLETIVAILEGRMTEDVRAVDITFKPAKVR